MSKASVFEASRVFFFASHLSDLFSDLFLLWIFIDLFWENIIFIKNFKSFFLFIFFFIFKYSFSRAKERKQTKRVGSESENGGDDVDGAVADDILVGSSPSSEQNMTEGESQEIAALQSASSSSSSGSPVESPAIQSIMDNLVGCTEKYLGKTEWIKFEPK